MNFDQMKQLVEIHRSGSINRAAQNLFMTQPSLSKSIGALEKELGREILVRTYTGTSLTPFGEEILRYAQDMLRSEESIRTLAREDTVSRQLNLRVSAAQMRFSTHAFLSVVSRHVHESVRVHHIQNSLSGVIFDVMNKTSEVGLIYISNHCSKKIIKVLRNSGIVYTPIHRFPPSLLVPHNHPLSGETRPERVAAMLREYTLAVPAEEMSVFREMHYEIARMLGVSKIVEEEVDGSYSDPVGEFDPLCLAVSMGVYEHAGLQVPRAMRVRQVPLPALPFEYVAGWIVGRKEAMSSMAAEYVEEITALCENSVSRLK